MCVVMKDDALHFTHKPYPKTKTKQLITTK